MFGLPVGVMLLLVGLVVSYRSDPRTFRTGLYLLAVITWGLLTLVGLAISLAERRFDDTIAAVVLLVLLGLLLVTVLTLAAFLITTGVTLVRREGFAVSRLLSIGLGVGMIGYVALWGLVLARNDLSLALFLLAVGVPLGYLGFGFVAFLLYGTLYPAIMARHGGPVAAVVVLGSGLLDGRVPPLLASRLDRGRELYRRFPSEKPLLVTSGGQGDDEPIAEGEAMAAYLIDQGVPSDRVLVEARSRNTEQNLRFSAALLAERGVSGPVGVVTNNFHAFRAAMLMRRLGIAGYSIGSSTARYYWPTAVIREFVAVLRDHRRLNAVLLGLCCLPLVVWLLGAVAGLVR
ncbi:MAG: YdcF family protein [Micropruina sp.]|nr:YdcF family protein [Micropruina sp.]